MEPIGIFYGSTYGKTAKAAEKIKQAFGNVKVDVYDLKKTSLADVKKYKNIILGTSAWGIGEMQDDWEYFIDTFNEVDLEGKKVALFGLGDQKEYPESFVDGLGTLYCRLNNKNVVVGETGTKGYQFYFSLAARENKFVGLVLDEHNQKELSDKRITDWVKQLKKEFI